MLSLLVTGCKKEEEKDKTSKGTTPPVTVEKPDEEPEKIEYSGPISQTTGVLLTVENKKNNHFAVMVENSKPARPHTGLASADIVYEMKVEYDITRFLAIYNDSIPNKIGPVRSSRHYYLPLSIDLNLPYIHFGGSSFAYNDLKLMKQTHIDGITQGKYFSRDNSRKAPHNAYLHPAKLPSFTEEIAGAPFTFAEKIDDSLPSVKEISFSYNNFTDVKYVFEPKIPAYKRFLEGDGHVDRETGSIIQTQNVIVLVAKHKKLGTSGNHIDIDFKAGGKAFYYTNGKKQEGTWVNLNGDLKFLDGNGEVVKLSKGKTWIQVIEETVSVVESIQ